MIGARLSELHAALDQLDAQRTRIHSWGEALARLLEGGGRVLAVGNGGSAAQAEHLTGELVGRFDGDRSPYAAIAIGAEFPTLTAICNDYGLDEMFARPVRAHGRAGDALVALSTSGRSPNVLAAVKAAQAQGLWTLALTGPAPNALASFCDERLTVEARATATIQEVHLVVIHLLCEAIDAALGVTK